MKISIQTPGKINLYLRVTGKRTDGFHELETLFLPIPEIVDSIELETLDDGENRVEVKSDHSGVPDGEKNIAFKAARLFLDELGNGCSVKIQIQKRIPVAAGMGGGSSDAAAVISALSRIYGFLPDGGKAIALKCGADVPFFLNPVPSVGRGVGEILEAVEGLHFPKISIHPMNFPVSAAWAYKHMIPESSPKKLADLLKALRNADFDALPHFIQNDLEMACRIKFPVLNLMEQKLKQTGVKNVRMTGSGPTLYSF